METYRFDVDGDPKPQPRTRIGRTKGGFSVAYDPGTAKSWKELVISAAKKVRPAVPLGGPLFLAVYLRFDRPASHYRKNGELKPAAPRWVCSKGRNDWDNCGKAVSDALNDIRFWQDDGQVAEAIVTKEYVMPGWRPGATIEVRRLEED